MIDATIPATPDNVGESAAAKLEAAFTRIHDERMRDVPILNPRLRVEAVGFRRHAWEDGDAWVGVLVTPWFINVVAVPCAVPDHAGRIAEREVVAVGASCGRTFPAGTVDFLGACEDGIGPFLACSLLSPVTEIADQETARELARAALEELYRADESARGMGGGRAMSKRDFMFGAFRSAAR